jgi:hypothetical protein
VKKFANSNFFLNLRDDEQKQPKKILVAPANNRQPESFLIITHTNQLQT